MTLFKTLLAAASLAIATPALADGTITIADPYAISAMPTAKTGATFMMITNTGGADDRLVSVSGDIAERIETHTHEAGADGMMKMIHVEDGFVIPAGGSLMLQRGAEHIMMLGLTRPLVQDETFTLTLTFEIAGDVVVEIPVDLNERPGAGMGHGHGTGHMAPAPSN